MPKMHQFSEGDVLLVFVDTMSTGGECEVGSVAASWPFETIRGASTVIYTVGAVI